LSMHEMETEAINESEKGSRSMDLFS
jgi:hypothetical protein